MTRRRLHIAILGLCTTIAISTLGLAMSSAEGTPEWMIPPPPSLPVELSTEAEGTLSLLTTISGVSTTVSCESLSGEKALLEVEGTSSGTLSYGGCQVLLNGKATAECEVHSNGSAVGTVVTNPLKGQLVLHEGLTLLRLQPLTGETFVTLEMGKGCPIGTKVPVLGAFYAKDSKGELDTEAVDHVLEAGPLTEMWAISKTTEHKATFDGSAKLSLAGEGLGVTWSGLGETPEWMIPPPPSLPVELSTEAEGTLSLLTTISGVSTTVSCESLSGEKALLEVEGTSSGTLSYGGCQVLLNGKATAECEVHSNGSAVGTVVTNPLKGQLVLHEGLTLLRLQPLTGETFVTLEMGKGCPIGTKVPVLGAFYAKDSKGELDTEAVDHVLEAGPLTEMWAISKTTEHKATFDGSAKLSLAGEGLGVTWSGLGETPEWMIPPPPSLPVELSTEAEGTLSLLTTISGVSTTVSCESLSGEKALLEVEGTSSGTLSYGGCQVLLNGKATAECEVHSNGSAVGTVVTNPLKGQLVLHEGLTLLRLQPLTGETFVTLEMGKGCPIGTKVPVLGAFYAKDSKGELDTEAVDHVLEAGPLTEMWAISKTTEHKATFDGSAKLSLAGEGLGVTWSGLGG